MHVTGLDMRYSRRSEDRPFKEIIERIRPVAPFRIAEVLYGVDSAELLSKLED